MQFVLKFFTIQKIGIGINLVFCRILEGETLQSSHKKLSVLYLIYAYAFRFFEAFLRYLIQLFSENLPQNLQLILFCCEKFSGLKGSSKIIGNNNHLTP